MPILRVEKLSRHFGGLKAVDGVTFAVEEHTVTSLIGPNGAGKTTVFNLITGLLPPTGGSIEFRGRQLAGRPPQAIARLGLGRTFQEPRVFAEMTVLENVLVGCPRQTGEGLLAALLRPPRVAAEERANRARAEELLAFVGLAERQHELAGQLAYGQQRFLSIARTLASDPELLLLDEPTVGLHRDEIVRLTGLVRELVRERGRTVVLVEHNMDVVMALSDWIVLLVEGQVVAAEPPAAIKQNPRLVEAYLGTGQAASYAQ